MGRRGEPERQLPGSMLAISVGRRRIGTAGRRGITREEGRKRV